MLTLVSAAECFHILFRTLHVKFALSQFCISHFVLDSTKKLIYVLNYLKDVAVIFNMISFSNSVIIRCVVIQKVHKILQCIYLFAQLNMTNSLYTTALKHIFTEISILCNTEQTLLCFAPITM